MVPHRRVFLFLQLEFGSTFCEPPRILIQRPLLPPHPTFCERATFSQETDVDLFVTAHLPRDLFFHIINRSIYTGGAICRPHLHSAGSHDHHFRIPHICTVPLPPRITPTLHFQSRGFGLVAEEFLDARYPLIEIRRNFCRYFIIGRFDTHFHIFILFIVACTSPPIGSLRLYVLPSLSPRRLLMRLRIVRARHQAR